MDVMRVGQIGRLKSERIDEYKTLHANVWSEVLKTIKKCHISNYSIFIKDNLVVSYYEYNGSEYDADMNKMADDPVTQDWWKLTRPCFEVFDEHSSEAFYEDMEGIFRLD